MTQPEPLAARPGRRTMLALPGLALAGALTAPRHGKAAAPAAVNGVVIGKDGWLFADWDVLRVVNPPAIARVTALMGEATAVLKSKGIEVAVALLPARSRLYPEMLPDGLALPAGAQQRYAQAAQQLAAGGAIVPDLATALQAARRAQPALPLFFKGDSHWMPAGAEVAAAAFAQEIRGKVALPPSGKPGASFGTPVEMEHIADLARLLPPGQRERFPPQSAMSRPVQAAGGLVAEDDAADVALVGNSYMQPKYGFSAILSYQLQRPVSLLWDVNLVGPWAMLLRFLGSAGFRQQRPRLLVWTIHELDLENMPDRTESWGPNSMPVPRFMSELRRLVGA